MQCTVTLSDGTELTSDRLITEYDLDFILRVFGKEKYADDAIRIIGEYLEITVTSNQ